MGKVVQFPDRGILPITIWRDEAATVLVLPGIRVERVPATPRRRRALSEIEREMVRRLRPPQD